VGGGYRLGALVGSKAQVLRRFQIVLLVLFGV
jgi:hypothetical protein